MQSGYAYIWRYRVPEDSAGDFERAYGSEGPWVELFRQHPGYVRTELHKDLQQPGCYTSIDYWQSKEACDAFRQESRAEFEALDTQCEQLTEEETLLGEFSRVR